MSSMSPLQTARLGYRPKLPRALQDLANAHLKPSDKILYSPHASDVASLFPNTHGLPSLTVVDGEKQSHPPMTVGVLLSGGQAPGGHNVIAGLFDGLKQINPKSRLIGFLDGPKGVIVDRSVEITDEMLASYRNQGGFDIIGSGRDKIETDEQFAVSLRTVQAHRLDGLVVIGGDDSNTNAALLAEYFAAKECPTAVVGVPKTIDGDLKNDYVEVSFGFDTASKNYSETIGALMRDALSAKKYYYFIKLMGRSASHIALECALKTHPNLALIGEEAAKKEMTLKGVTDEIADLICLRADKGKDYGVILIPEGIVEFIPEVKALIKELNVHLSPDVSHHEAIDKLATGQEKVAYISKLLSKQSLGCFALLPADIQAQLLIGRDAHGNVQVSKIETERLFIELVKAELKRRAKEGSYKGKFSSQPHFCGYEGRSCLPSNFDAEYCYSLGLTAALLVSGKASGYICHLNRLAKSAEEWIPGGVPLTSLMTVEERHGKLKPVIEKALVDLNGRPFLAFARQREKWQVEDDYLNPGPIQFFGPEALTDGVSETLKLESSFPA